MIVTFSFAVYMFVIEKKWKKIDLHEQNGNDDSILVWWLYVSFKQNRLTPCKAEQPLQGMELQEKEVQKD